MSKDAKSLMLYRDQAAEFHAAARIIQTDGVEGIRTAAQIVGNDVALGMLLMWMRVGHYDGETYPIPDDVTHKTNRDMVRAAVLTLQTDTPST